MRLSAILQSLNLKLQLQHGPIR